MRIITGEFRGRRLQSPATNDVRPTSDKVKESVFNLLMPYLNENCICMDLFAGSGNLGLEALSRGAKLCYFSDSSRDSIRLIKENIKICKVEGRSVLLSGDFRSNIGRVHEKLDIIFMDPPYKSDFYLSALDAIRAADILNEGGCIVCEHAEKDSLPDEYSGFRKVKEKRYGSIGVCIYE